MRFLNWFGSKPKNINKFNQAFFGIGGAFTSYDNNSKTYLEKGYNINPFIFSVVNSIATKTASIPFYIKKVEDERQKNLRDNLIKSTNYNLTPQQLIKKYNYEEKAFKDDYLEFPLEKPNPLQTWTEFIQLYSVMLNLTGNVYIYALKPENGINKGQPIALYLLPSHLMQIVLVDKPNYLSIESPVSHYILTEGNQFIEFKKEEVYHIKYPNPNYDQEGSHLYGQSQLRAGLKNIQSTNEGLDLNIKTLKNGGAYGLIHSKGNNALTQEQAKSLKDRLKEMDNDTSRLAKIAGVSAEVGFTRLSLTSDELKPFDYFDFDLKTICTLFNWDDKAMNNDKGAKYDNYNIAGKRNITNKVLPDLKLLQDCFNRDIIPLYKGYEKTYFEFDVSELSEMQEDMVNLVTWMKEALDRGVINRNEARTLLNFVKTEDLLMEEFTVVNDVLTLEQALDDLPKIE